MTETSTTTKNTRPETVEDLSDFDLRGHTIATITGADQLLRFPSLGQHLLAAIAEAEHLGLKVEAGEITVPLTEDEETNKVVSAQRSWDHSRDKYQQALVDPASIESFYRYQVNNWAKAEGMPAIEWPEVQS